MYNERSWAEELNKEINQHLKKIIKLIKKNRYKDSEVAIKANISAGYLSKIISNRTRNVSIEYLIRLAKSVGYKFDYLEFIDRHTIIAEGMELTRYAKGHKDNRNRELRKPHRNKIQKTDDIKIVIQKSFDNELEDSIEDFRKFINSKDKRKKEYEKLKQEFEN